MRRTGLCMAACLLVASCGVLPSDEQREETCTIPVVRITGVDVTPIDREQRDGQTHYSFPDTLRGQVAFQAETEYEKLGEETVACPDDPLADPMPGQVVNPVEGMGYVVRFDRPLQVLDEAIPAETNLLEVEALQDEYGLRSRLSPFAIVELHFDRTIYTFPEDAYRGAFAWITSEGEIIGDSVQVYIDLP